MRSAKEEISAKVIGITQPVVDYIPESEDIISYAARVSNPSNQSNFSTSKGLLDYCVKHGHWSVFETCNAVVEIKVPRDISRQVLRHRSGAFQEFSQRYAEVDENMFVLRECRMQDTKNRQNSFECKDEETLAWWEQTQIDHVRDTVKRYQEAISKGVAKEVARVLLPEGLTMSTMYMNASMRTWLHYCQLRGGNGTQTEHIWLAEKCKEALEEHFPTLFSLTQK
jgi:thymidylate synthase (FAD)